MHVNEIGDFVVITGIPFRGGDWLARVLHQPQAGVVCYYQAKMSWISPGHTWWEYTENEATYWDRATSNISNRMDPVYDCYLDELRYWRWRYRVVGDMHSFLPVMAPHLIQHTGARGLIVVIRNGIVAVDELWQYYKSGKEPPAAYACVIRRTLGQMEMAIPRQSIEDKPFEWWCRFWASNMHTREWLASVTPNDIGVTSILIESLMSDADALSSFLRGDFPLLTHSRVDYIELTRGGCEYMPGPDPLAIWSRWNGRQRDTFRLYCGGAMGDLGYDVPC